VEKPPIRDAGSLGLIMGALAVADFLGPLLVGKSRSDVLIMSLFGVIAGQLAVIVIWAALGPQRWFERLPAMLAFTLLILAAVMFGTAVGEGFAPRAHDVAAFFFPVPLVFLSAQFPLWIRRLVGGWRIVRADADVSDATTQARQFRLQDMFVVTGVVAVAFSLASVGLGHERDMYDAWFSLLIASLMCTIWSAFSTLPCLWACFIAPDKVGGAVVIGVYVTVMTGIVLAVGTMFDGSAPPADAVVGIFLFHAALVGVMLGVLHAFRARGYVLHRAARKRPTTPQAHRPPDADAKEPDSPCEPREPD
jgi:hypothetical protein